MLILKRKVGQSVRIANDIYITVMRDEQNQIVLGFDAPSHISIHREEVYRDLEKQNAEDIYMHQQKKSFLAYQPLKKTG